VAACAGSLTCPASDCSSQSSQLRARTGQNLIAVLLLLGQQTSNLVCECETVWLLCQLVAARLPGWLAAGTRSTLQSFTSRRSPTPRCCGCHGTSRTRGTLQVQAGRYRLYCCVGGGDKARGPAAEEWLAEWVLLKIELLAALSSLPISLAPVPPPLPSLACLPAALAMDSTRVTVLDIRYPTLPVAELQRHQVRHPALHSPPLQLPCRRGYCGCLRCQLAARLPACACT
jgi:hypothetical protein